MYKKFKNFLEKCENICLETVKKSSASSMEVITALYWVLMENEDSDLVEFNLTKSEKETLIRDYNKILTDRGKNLFWEHLSCCRSLATA